MANRQKQIILKWGQFIWKDTLKSRKTYIELLLTFLFTSIIWWCFFGRDKAWEQLMENLIPGLVAVVIALIIMVIEKLGEARQVVRTEINDRRRMESLHESEVNQIIFWLSGKLADERLGIQQAYLFGSVTHSHYSTGDVDVAVLFRKMKDAGFVKKVRILPSIAQEFNKTFNKPLHFQRFVAEETISFSDFIARQSEPLLILQDS